jgi:hypothetical protein
MANDPQTKDEKLTSFDRKRFEQAPCYLCGYNGEGYYQPGIHRCAAMYHGYVLPDIVTSKLDVSGLVSDLVACALIEGNCSTASAEQQTKAAKQRLLDRIEELRRDVVNWRSASETNLATCARLREQMRGVETSPPTGWQPMETAPKDGTPILGWCDHEADPYFANDGTGNLTLYGGHVEGMSNVEDGPHVIVWGGSWDDRSHEEPTAGYIPDWWFQYGSDFEIAANPTRWMPIPQVNGTSLKGSSPATPPGEQT